MSLQAVRIDGPAGALAGWTSQGSGDPQSPVVFLHPINTRGRIWAGVIEHLTASRPYFLPDLRGHGDSDAEGDFGLDEWLSDIEAFIDALGLTEPFHVVGGSLGGSLAVCLAERRPDQVLSLAGVGSALNFPGTDLHGVLDMFDELGVEGSFRAMFAENIFGPHASAEMIEEGIQFANPNDVETVKRVWLATVTSDSSARAAGVSAPALVITGEFDATCTPALGLEMARALKTEQVLVPEVGHLPMLEIPQRLAQMLELHFSLSKSR